MYVFLYMLVTAPPITCKAKGPVNVTAEPGKGAKAKWPKGVYTVIDGDKKFAQLEGAKGSGWMKLADVKKACGPKVLKEVTLAYAGKKADKTQPAEPVPATPPAESAPVAETPSARRITIALVELKGPDRVSPELRETVRDAITAALKDHGSFVPVKPPSDAQVRLKECKDVQCLAEVGRALGADWIVTGTLNQVVQSYSLQLQLTNVSNAAPGQRVTRDYKGAPEGLTEEARAAGKLLAEAVLNPQPVADAPRAEPASEPAKDAPPVASTSPPPAETTSVALTQPAPRGDDNKRTVYRAVGFSFVGLGAAAAAGGAVLMTLNMLTLPALQSASADYNASLFRTTAQFDALGRAWTTFDTRFVASLAMMGFGVASLVVGVTLLAIAPKSNAASASLELQMGPGRLGALVKF